LKGHSGKNVRALASISDLKTLDMVATGGEDGAIKVWDINQMKQTKTRQLNQQASSQLQLRIPLPSGELHDLQTEKGAEVNKIRSIEVLRDCRILLTT
jgi:WD40 repeat protein